MNFGKSVNLFEPLLLIWVEVLRICSFSDSPADEVKFAHGPGLINDRHYKNKMLQFQHEKEQRLLPSSSTPPLTQEESGGDFFVRWLLLIMIY